MRLHNFLGQSDSKTRQLVVDAGGGTVDLIRFEMSISKGTKAISKGTKAKMTTIGLPRGELIGSSLINDDFVKRTFGKSFQLPVRYKNMTELLKDLSITEDNFRLQAYEMFERLKVGYSKIQDTEGMVLTGKTKKVTLYVQKTLVWECIDRGIKKVTHLIDELMDKETKVIILSGGFGTSKELRTRLEARYKNAGVRVMPVETLPGQAYLPVAHGALLRHEKIELGALPSGFSYFTTQDYPYDPAVHLDIEQSPSRVQQSNWNNQREAPNRITNLLETTDTQTNGTMIEKSAFSYWMMLPEDLKISADIYWSKKDLKQESALADYRSPSEDPINPEYRQWKRIEVNVPRELLEEKGYKAKDKTAVEREAYYKIKGRIVLETNGAIMRAIFQIASANQKPCTLISEYGLEFPHHSMN